MLNYIIWDWDPEIFSLGFLHIRYYGLLFAAGFAIGYQILKKVFLKEGTKIEWLDSLLMYVLAGTVIGARLGHCLFYEPAHYLSHPIDILKVWEGGLASHGGAIGILIALWMYSRKVTKKPMWWTMDRLALVVGIAGCLIRVGNLANSEIYGHATDSDFGFVHVHDSYFGRYINEDKIAKYLDDYEFEKGTDVDGKQQATITLQYNRYIKTEQDARSLTEYRIKPLLKHRTGSDGSDPNLYIEEDSQISYSNTNGRYSAVVPVVVIPKHPTHIYEAACYLFTFLLLMFIYKKGGLNKPGLIFGLFFFCIFGARFFIEIIKENQVATEVGKALNNGQKLSIPFIIGGLYFAAKALLPAKDKQD